MVVKQHQGLLHLSVFVLDICFEHFLFLHFSFLRHSLSGHCFCCIIVSASVFLHFVFFALFSRCCIIVFVCFSTFYVHVCFACFFFAFVFLLLFL